LTRAKGSLVAGASLVVLGLMGPEAAAQSRVEPSLSVSGNSGYSSNPFLTAGEDVDAFVVQVDVRPALDLRTERDAMHLEAFYTRTEYPDAFEATDTFGALFNASSQIDEQSTLRTVISFDSMVLGTTDALLPGVGIPPGSEPGVLPDPAAAPGPSAPTPGLDIGDLPDGDIDLVGLRQRRNSLSVEVTAELRPGPRSMWAFSANASGADYPRSGSTASSYRSVGLSANHRRELSGRSAVGARADVYAVDYKSGPTSKVYTLQGFVSHRLAERWSLEATAGASVLDGDSNLFMFAGQVTVCDASGRTRICLLASRAPVVSGFSGVRGQTSLGANFDRRLDARSNVAAAVSYVWSGEESSFGMGQRRFIAVNATYRRDMGGQLSLFAALDGRHIRSAVVSGRKDIAGRVGASMRFGGPR
jgi:hypothetical protein